MTRHIIKIIKTLSKAQKSVMEALCTMSESEVEADIIKPHTLGVLCIHGLINVVDGKAQPTCVFLWNMINHPKMYNGINKSCMDEIGEHLGNGKRIAAVRVLRTYSGMDLKSSVAWMDYHFPR